MKSLEHGLVILPWLFTKATILTSAKTLTLGKFFPSKFLPFVPLVMLIININTENMNINSKGNNKNCVVGGTTT